MNNNIYHIEIKKEYAAAIIEDLIQMDAIEILEFPIPKWQQEESLKRLAEYQKNPSLGIGEAAFFNELAEKDEKL